MLKSLIKKRFSVFLLIISLFILIYLLLSYSDFYHIINDRSKLTEWTQSLGYIGPLMIISLITLAIVISPIPSAPVALTAGALYGHTEGTLYVVIGAELGAIIAFMTTRISGINFINNWFKNSQLKYFSGSQNNLMGIVFISRLLPFISFDIVSYAAGLTSLTFWRFAFATFAGIIPASFLLAHFGSQLTSNENQNIGLTLLVLGCISLILFLLNSFFKKNNSTET